ncbi:aldehyde ferredoxin oxidoreductase [Cetobacterium sp. 2A]|uniref:aldehyde ferredoxin oxidoreductase n=1 Tax=unclassified Cetobacterium TaxID=2630983 RepID=UPI00163BFD44|nr:aldehyde ferredoxin oxidoreductase [Cetobacterium sp. 2A]MBC2855124.1 aldehyde ferredoxin oxidoreductase [Cetobacterium sp. 2A]
MNNSYGWAGKILRVNLSNGKITIENTEKFKSLIGGMGIGYKVLFDEVPAGTKAFDEANKIIFAVGPLTGSGAPSSSRTNITSLLPSNPYNAVSDSHMGGNFAAHLKYAGYDAIIIEGKSSRPVWLKIDDDNVSIEDASRVWGTGIKDTTAQLSSLMGKDASIAAIGQAGENMVNLSVIMTGISHSAGGHGGVLGSKMLKAIGVRGTQAVKIAGKGRDLLKLNNYMMKDLIGANNQHVVPSTPQPWAEFHSKGSRWTAKEGLTWGAAEGGPVETGIAAAGDVNKVGFRTMKATFDLGPSAEKYTVRMGGCQSCPIRCMSHLKIPKLQDYGVSPYVANSCMGYFSPQRVMFKGNKDIEEKGDGKMFAAAIGASLADDYGVWCNYGLLGTDLRHAYETGIFKKVLPAAEYDSIPWHLLEDKDPAFLVDFYRRIAYKEGELGHLGEGAYWVAKRWNFGDDYWNNVQYGLWSRLGFPKHHSNETNGQVGSLISCMFNRDAQSHTLVNLVGSGLPIEIQKDVVAEIVGSPMGIDAPKNYTPMNEYKAKLAKWAIIKNCLHDSLTVCNWMWPMTVSPHKSRNYRGDLGLEAKFMTVVTGENYTEESLDLAAERIFTLHRALTVKNMNTIDMRNEHDGMTEWVFDKDPEIPVFTPGTDKMDRKDMQVALTMFYKEMGWDEKTGAPTKATLDRLGLSDVAKELKKMNLLPA